MNVLRHYNLFLLRSYHMYTEAGEKRTQALPWNHCEEKHFDLLLTVTPDRPTAVGIMYLQCKSTYSLGSIKSSVIFPHSSAAIGLILPCFHLREEPRAAGSVSLV